MASQLKKQLAANDHIVSYLEYYLSLSYPPQYAVLINGAWGIGKTYFIKKFLRDSFKDPEGYCYVSLYGAATTEDIDNAILQASYPLLASNGARIVGRLAKAGMKYIRFDPDLKLAEFLKKKDIKIFIFDDLERCLMPINKVLGYINEIVEHDDGKVVIIANEKELNKDAEYLRCKEKLIGKTLELQSSFDEAYAFFCSRIDCKKAQGFLSTYATYIADIYRLSELQNLRILQQAMWDFERLVKAIPDKYLTYETAIKEIIGLFFPMAMEFKAGRISEKDLTDRVNRIVRATIDNDPTKVAPLRLANDRYPVKLYHDILSDEILIDCFVKGRFDSSKIQKLFEESPYFTKKIDPAWRTVWYGIEKTDEEFNPALAEMEKQFQDRAFILSGEITHVFGLRLWLSEIGAIKSDTKTIIAECKQYVDDLYRSKKLEPTANNGQSDIRFSGYGGLSIFYAEKDEFKELYEYLENKRHQAEQDSYKQIALSLMDLMSNPDNLYDQLCYTRGGNHQYANAPVLASLDPQIFVKKMLLCSPKAQRDIVHIFKGRYEAGALSGRLKAERVWIEQLKTALLEAAEKLSPLQRYRIKNDIRHSIDPALQNLVDE